MCTINAHSEVKGAEPSVVDPRGYRQNSANENEREIQWLSNGGKIRSNGPGVLEKYRSLVRNFSRLKQNKIGYF